MTIKELIEKSGDSELLSCRYENSKLHVTINFGEIEEIFHIEINTNIMHINLPIKFEPPFNTSYIEIIELDKVLLRQDNGFFMPPLTFKEVMEEKKRNLNLGYGLRANNNILLFSLIGDKRLVSCIISNENDIQLKQQFN